MAEVITWHREILPPVQRELWEARLTGDFPGWVLYGGTALALRLGHRTSVDFDFFSSRPLAPIDFKEAHGLEGEVIQAAENTLTVLHRGVKLSFFGGLTLHVVQPPNLLGRCPVAALEDLAACKLAALVNRVEVKDYQDIAALLRHGIGLPRMLGCANAVYRGEFPVTACLKSLAWFESPALEGLDAEDRHLLEAAALAVEEIPVVEVRDGLIGA